MNKTTINEISKKIQNILAENNVPMDKIGEVLVLSSQYIKSRTIVKKIN